MNRFLGVAFVAVVLCFASANDAEAGCRNGRCGRWFPGRTVVRGTAHVARGAARIALAPPRLLARATFRPHGRLRTCGPNGCH